MDILSYTLGKKAGGGGSTINNQNKTFTENGQYVADSGYTGLGTVTVNVPQPTGTINITENGTTNVTDYASANVNVQPDLETKSVTITENTTTTITPTSGKDGLSSVEVVTNVSGGGGILQEKNVNFYDYDGTITNSYTKEEFLALNELPSNPSHSGLTAQGWNWDLLDAKTYVTNYGKLNIGQNYITSDGKTRIYIELTEGRLSPYLSFGINGTATIDWGDGSASQSVTGTSVTTLIHTLHEYSNAGEYVITIDSNTKIYIIGSANGGSSLIWAKNSSENSINKTYQSSIKKIEFGNVEFRDKAFKNCSSLTSITIPSSVTSIGTNAFSGCYSLSSITIPSSVTSIGTYVFSTCSSLSSITIPSSVTSIGDYSFINCYLLSSITIPSSVISIGSSAFSSCYSLSSITIPSSVTSIDNNAFINCYLLSSITIPSSVIRIGSSFFSSCSSLSSITIPSSVTSIGTNAFTCCYSMAYYDFTSSSSVPSLSNTSAFSSMPSDCKIIVPDSLYEDWISATNWSYYESQIIKESDWNNA